MKKKHNLYFSKYYEKFQHLLLSEEKIFEKLEIAKNNILKLKKKKSKILIFANGGSFAITSHFTIDIMKNTGIRCQNFSDPSMLTCLSNDYGYENWVSKAVEYYADKGDMLILISSSGMSPNILNSVKNKKNLFSFIMTFSGFSENNKLRRIGNLNFHVNSKVYNFIENIHQIWLLSIIDRLTTTKI
jgi:D-sedoheptulose 7-phosphate isomerase